MRRVYGHKLSNVYEAQHSSKRRALREADAAEFVVLIAMKGPDGKTYDSIGYADKDTDIDYQNGIYGYDNDIRENVHAMTRADATKLCADIIEQAPAGDAIVGVVPYSTIPAEGGSAEDVEPSEDDMEIPGSEDADTDEGSDEGEEEPAEDEGESDEDDEDNE